jgi:predicted porin
MKKSLIALAVLAASGGAMAQSSVTLYGLVDAGVGRTSTTTNVYAPAGSNVLATSVKNTQTRVLSGGANNSRWGLRGTEDLGGGLKANFVLESGFNTDDGTAAGVQFNRQAFVGLSGDFGSVSLGRQYTAYFALHNATNNLYDTNLATTSAPPFGLSVWGNGVARHSDRADNSIAYTSPVFSGFSGAAVVGLGEDKNFGNVQNSATGNNSLHVKYANGPLLVGYAYQQEKTSPTPLVANSTVSAKYNLFAGSYDFGVAKLTGGFSVAKQTTREDKEFQVGVSVPFGAAAVAAGYSYSKSENSLPAGVVTNKASGLSLLGTYSLSKRTTLYAGLAGVNFKNNAGASLTKTSVVATGVRHTF